MAEEIFVAAYDGHDSHVVDFAISRAKRDGAAVHIVHVLEWSPYSLLTQEELAVRHKVRGEELQRAEALVLTPMLKKAALLGIAVTGEVRHGNVVDTICAIATEKRATLIFAGRSNRLSTRVFGSVASGLAQLAPVAAVIVP